MRAGLRERLAAGPVLFADGATGSLLQSRGHGGCLELLNLEAPEVVAALHRDYRDAGAEVLWANSFGASPRRLAPHGLADRTEEVNRVAAELARDAAGDAVFVAGSIGPCGEPLAPFGTLDPEVLGREFARQARGLAEGGIDAFAVETMMDLEEALVALRAAQETAPELPVFVTLTFQETPAGLFTPYGNPPADAAVRLAEAGVDVIGANCGTGPGPMIEVARRMRAATDTPLLFRPNAGLPEVTDEGTVWPETPERFAEAIRELAGLGAAILGGCCGTTPAHVRAYRAPA